MTSPDDTLAAGIAGLILFAGWIFLVVAGVVAAKRRGRSPHWMWFGLHPFGAFIACIVLCSLKPLKACPDCTRRAPSQARLCPYCGHAFELIRAAQAAPDAAAAVEGKA